MSSKVLLVLCSVTLLGLAGCGSSSNGSKSSASQSSSSISSQVASSSQASSSNESSASSLPALHPLTGLAMAKTPLANATVKARCADGSGFVVAVVTNAQGIFSGQVARDALPCALQVTGGTPAVTLHGYAATPGRVNITAFTDILLTDASGQRPGDWFDSANWQSVGDELLAAQTRMILALVARGYTLPGGFTPLVQEFSHGDAWSELINDVLDAVDASTSIADYDALLTLVKDGNLAVIPGPVSGGGSSSSSSSSVGSSSSASSVASSSSSAASGTGSAGACFNPALVASGAKVIYTYRTTDAAGPVIQFTTTIEVKNQTTFKGQPALETVSVTETVGAAPSSSVSHGFISVDIANKRSLTLGNRVETSAPIVVTSETAFSPAMLMRFDLNAGESYSQSFDSTTTTTTMGLTIPVTTSNSATTTFAGIESVTVPAGTFDACRFDIQDNNGLTKRWVSVDDGVEIKVEAFDGDVTVLLSGSLNGAAF